MPQMISVFFCVAVLWIQVDTLQQFTIAVENGTYATDLPIRTAILIYLFWYLCLFTRGYWFKDAATYNFLDIFTRKSYHNIANHQESIRQLAWKKNQQQPFTEKKLTHTDSPFDKESPQPASFLSSFLSFFLSSCEQQDGMGQKGDFSARAPVYPWLVDVEKISNPMGISSQWGFFTVSGI